MRSCKSKAQNSSKVLRYARSKWSFALHLKLHDFITKKCVHDLICELIGDYHAKACDKIFAVVKFKNVFGNSIKSNHVHFPCIFVSAGLKLPMMDVEWHCRKWIIIAFAGSVNSMAWNECHGDCLLLLSHRLQGIWYELRNRFTIDHFPHVLQGWVITLEWKKFPTSSSSNLSRSMYSNWFPNDWLHSAQWFGVNVGWHGPHLDVGRCRSVPAVVCQFYYAFDK